MPRYGGRSDWSGVCGWCPGVTKGLGLCGNVARLAILDFRYRIVSSWRKNEVSGRKTEEIPTAHMSRDVYPAKWPFSSQPTTPSPHKASQNSF
jgi:hypothetical protein